MFDEYVVDRLVVLVTRIKLAAALRLAQMDPIGGAIAGALEARRLAERSVVCRRSRGVVCHLDRLDLEMHALAMLKTADDLE